MDNKKLLTEIGKRINGKNGDYKIKDKKHGFKVCSGKCPKNEKTNNN